MMKAIPTPPPRPVLAIAARRVLRRPRLFLLLWLLSLLLSIVASLPLLFALHEVLDLRPLAARLAAGQVDWLWLEVLGEHGELLWTAVPPLLGAAGLYFLLSTLLSAGLLSALRRPGDPRRVVGAQVLAVAAVLGPAVLGVSLWGLLLRLPALALGWGVFHVMSRWAPAWSFPLWAAVLAAGMALCLLTWSAGSVVIHYAQLLRMAHRAGGPLPGLRALEQGLSFWFRSPWHVRLTLRLALASLLGLGLLLGLEHLCAGWAQNLRFRSGPWTVLVLGQLFAVGRAVIGLTVLAGAVEAVDTQQE